jgi:hypothetical protein
LYYETSDIYLAGFLQASELPLQTNRRQGSQTIFCFEQTDKLMQLVENYYKMKAVINPLAYGSALKILKNIVYQQKNTYNYYDNSNINHQSRKVS